MKNYFKKKFILAVSIFLLFSTHLLGITNQDTLIVNSDPSNKTEQMDVQENYSALYKRADEYSKSSSGIDSISKYIIGDKIKVLSIIFGKDATDKNFEKKKNIHIETLIIEIKEKAKSDSNFTISKYNEIIEDLEKLKVGTLTINEQKNLNERLETIAANSPDFKSKINIFKKSDVSNDVSGSPSIIKNLQGLNSLNSILPTPAILIDGTAQFLVNRTKKELNIAYVDKFRNAFKEYPQMQVLFPSVSNVILYNDPLSFSVWSSQLQQATQLDIQNVANNYYLMIKSDSLYRSMSKTEKELFEVFFMSMSVAQMNQKLMVPHEILANLSYQFAYSENDTLLVNKGLSLIKALENSVYIDKGKYMDNRLIHNAFSIKSKKDRYFINLLLIQNKELLMSIVGDDFYELLVPIDQENVTYSKLEVLKEFQHTIIDIKQSIENSNILISKLNNPIEGLNKREVMFSLLDESLILYDAAFRMAYIGKTEGALYASSSKYMDYHSMLSNSIQLAKNISDRNYPGILVSFNNIVSVSFDKLIELQAAKIDAGNTDLNGKSRCDKKVGMQKLVPDYEILNRYKDMLSIIVYWGGVMSEVASLDSAHNVNMLLERYAEPVGSYRIKRNSKFSVSLNAYPGLYMGTEYGIEEKKFRFGYGVTAPIGLSLNWSSRKKATSKHFDYYKDGKLKKYTGYVHGIFLPLIDIGAPFVYRWSADDGDGFPDELKWEQVFAPGIYYTFGFKNSGLTLKAGAQWAPSLAKVTATEIGLNNDAVRMGITATYDIPLFTLRK